MNKTNEPPVKVIFQLYNEFRLCAGHDRDNTPAENLWLNDYGNPVLLKEPEDEAAFMDITVLSKIEMKFTFDMIDTDEDIKTKIKELQEKALNHKARHWASLDWSRGKKWVTTQKNLERSLIAVQTGKPYSVIVSVLNLADSKATAEKLKSADKEAKRLYMNAERLIEAAKIGFHEFRKVAMKPLPRDI
jgi:hypothetical protein